MKTNNLLDKSSKFPTSSGVYIMKNSQDKIIYVGKSKNLKKRVKSYFLKSSSKSIFLMSQTKDITYLLANTEVDALLLEASLIKKHKPKYNVRLKDDKAYPYIKLSIKDKFPRIYIVRRAINDSNLYFGPYSSSSVVHGTIKFLNKNFNIRDCKDVDFRNRQKPCLTYQMGYCKAPCVNLISEEEYKLDVKQVLNFLKGKSKKVINLIKKQMNEAAKNEQFETASKIRDSLFAVEKLLENQPIISNNSKVDRDIIGYFSSEQGIMISSLHVRKGRKVGNRNFFLSYLDSNIELYDKPRSWLVSFLNQYYLENIIPDEILIPVDLSLDLTKLLKKALKKRSKKTVEIRFPTDPDGSKLIQAALLDAHDKFKEYVSTSDKKLNALKEIQKKLKLTKIPKKIECFDISTFQGQETVASQAVFKDGVPSKEHYRRYKIKTLGLSDYDAMKQVLTRRLKHGELPELILVDGGKGQLNCALVVLKEFNLKVPVVGIAKSRTESNFLKKDINVSEERFFLPHRKNPVTFKTNSESFKILTNIRNEAHRFAITYHRKLRESTSLESELDITGISEANKITLLKHFKSLKELKRASINEIAAIKGFSKSKAKKIKEALKS